MHTLAKRLVTCRQLAILGLILTMLSLAASDASAQYGRYRGRGGYGRGYYGGGYYSRGYAGVYRPPVYARPYVGGYYGPRVYSRGYGGVYGYPYARPYVAPPIVVAPGLGYGYGAYGYPY